MGKIKFVTNKQWYGLARRLEKENLKKRGRSLDSPSIAFAANRFIVEVESKGVLAKRGWQKAMKDRANDNLLPNTSEYAAPINSRNRRKE